MIRRECSLLSVRLKKTDVVALCLFSLLIVFGLVFVAIDAAFLRSTDVFARFFWCINADNHNALTVASLWAPVFCIYLLDIYLFYTIVSAVWGFLLGARARLGEIRSLDALQQLFEQFPVAFMEKLHIQLPTRLYFLFSH
ncbi:hypothetical protein Dimus_012617 [Dionaea muscipula]